MCIFGGGGGGDDSARREAERQAGIQQTTDLINSIFSDPGREQAYASHRANVMGLNQEELDRQKREAERQLTFDLARRGVAGGSADVDERAQLLERYNRGVADVSRHAEGAASGLRSADERAKLGLIRDAQTGIDTGTAQRLALDSLSSNLSEASAGAQMQGLGNLFADLAYMNRAKAVQTGRAGARAPYDDQAIYPRTSGGQGYQGTTARIG